jgi:hypothetical protein
MGWLKRILGREKSHEEWLADHPGKSSDKHVEAEVDQDEQARIRASMEEDLAGQRAQRDSQ